MNPYLPEWNIETELPAPHQKKPMGFDHELVELLWRNGEVVLHSQTHKNSQVMILMNADSLTNMINQQ